MTSNILGNITNRYLITNSDLYEDIILYHFLHPIERGFYVDVGCSDPVYGSITKFFYDRDWSGINIDALSHEIDKYSNLRPRDLNCFGGVSNKEGQLAFWACNEAPGLSTFDEETAVSLSGETNIFGGRWTFTEITVPVVTLNYILDTYLQSEVIHFLKIDVEQHERQVLEGIDLSRYKPWIIMVEATKPYTMIPTHQNWEQILLDNNYEFLLQSSVNRFYAISEKKNELQQNYLTHPVTPVMRLEEYLRINELLSSS